MDQDVKNYIAYIERLASKGKYFIEYECPVCRETLHSLVPEKGETYSTMFVCPYCSQQHFRVVHDDSSIVIDGEEVG